VLVRDSGYRLSFALEVTSKSKTIFLYFLSVFVPGVGKVLAAG
jgi:hypothetical protein